MKHELLNHALTRGMLLALVSGVVACAGESQSTKPITSDVATSSEEFRLLAEQHVNAYARALIERDAATLDELLSSEVKARLAGYEGGSERFMDKQRRTLLQAFPELETAEPEDGFSVTKVAAQEGVVSVTFGYRDRELARPFYFVKEGERYTLNVARPGFSAPLAEGALPNDSYQISADSDAQPANIGCYRGQSVNVQPAYYIGSYNNYYVSCPNVCGFWHGANFGSSGQWLGAPNCDYNTWGTDVWVGWFGAQCNDSC